jgi:plasmid stabilization system protein ParE
MHDSLKLKFTPEAKEDLPGIFEYIERNLSAPKAAINLINKIEQSCQRLTSNPLSCPASKDKVLAKRVIAC